MILAGTSQALTPSVATLTLGRTQQFTAANLGSAPTWSVDGIVGGNATVGTISTSGVYTAGTGAGAAGQHSILGVSSSDNTQSAIAMAAVTDLPGVYTYHNDLSRDGANIQEYALTLSTVKASRFGKLTSCAVDGAVFAQPLWVANLTVGGKPHNVVFVATENDGLFAFDADAVPCGSPLAQANLLDAAHGGVTGETAVPWNMVGAGAGDIQWQIGVTGTPVIDPATNTLYVVSKSLAGSTFNQRLHALDLATLSEKPGSPLAISAQVQGTGDGGTTVTFAAQQHNQRAGLAFANNTVYIAWAGHDDAPTPIYHGWVLGYQYNGSKLTQTAVFNPTPNDKFGGVWMSGGAPGADAAGNIYFVTGNGGSHTAPGNRDESLLKLKSDLTTVLDSFTPSNPDALNSVDADFGAGGAVLLADLPAGNTVTHVVIGNGKNGTVYVLNRDMLGGLGDQNALQSFILGPNNGSDVFFSTPVFWNNRLYLTPTDLGISAYQLNTATATFNTTAASQSSHVFAGHGTIASLSASSASSNGILWSLDVANYCTLSGTGNAPCGPAVLYAYDATNLATELYHSSSTGGAADAAGNAVKFTVPMIANGHVYFGTRGNNIGSNASNTGGAYPAGATPIAGELDIYGIKN
ncbi:MAG: hypothetical protein JOY91_00330 [Sinobacteraceae bacterium]|nr:hypothetical protein [Nevskiaceae bacterium]